MLSLITSETFNKLDEAHTAQVYTATGLVETAGEIIGVPILSAAFIGGIEIGGYGLGLPFFICTVSLTARSVSDGFCHTTIELTTRFSRGFTCVPGLRYGTYVITK